MAWPDFLEKLTQHHGRYVGVARDSFEGRPEIPTQPKPKQPMVEPGVGVGVEPGVAVARLAKPLGTAVIAPVKVIDRHGRVNQSLHEAAFGAGAVEPKILPDLMGFEVFAGIEQGGAGFEQTLMFR
jgi:hypothetical protein